jgi:perosamine synthetase
VHEIRLLPPRVAGQRVTFAWTVTPASSLYERSAFTLDFPEAVDPASVPEGIWWRVMLACLHPHWVLLRPCRVVLGVQLAPGEREAWLRLTDAAAWALDARAGDGVHPRAIDLVESGPAPAPLTPGPDAGLTAACFSGGRDSLVQTALLQELGERPLLVTTTSTRPGSLEHDTARREEVLAEVVRRRGLELVEVCSDFRSLVDVGFSARYRVGVTELTDCLLFFGVALAVAAARGARRIAMASEHEVQHTERTGGRIVQTAHFMYSAVTQSALESIIAPSGIRFGGLTSSLLQFQVQRLLVRRYPELRDLQYSCWSMTAGQAACSACFECARIALNVAAEGASPAEQGLDLATVVQAREDWWPKPVEQDLANERLGGGVRDAMRDQVLRCLARLPADDRVAGLLGDDPALVAEYAAWRSEKLAAAGPLPPEPGYASAYLELVEPALRPGLRAILTEHFEPTTDGADQAALARTQTLASWIAAPMADPELDLRRRRRVASDAAPPPAPVHAGPRLPAPLTAAELAPLADSVPDAEPALGDAPRGRVLRVASTLLDGNERRYVNQCLDENHISSTGPFVRRFEEAMAAAAGCAHAVACASGGTALQLAYAAAGVGPGDEVIMPALTMVATANSAGHLGAVPVFVDTDPHTWNLDPERVAEAIGPRTRAICVVHTYGQPVDPAPFRRLAERNGLALIEDAAEAHGAQAHGERVGSLGTVAAFSFYGNKILTTGEGGVVTTDSPEVAALARELRDHGFSPERHFWHRLRAYNFRMSSLQAAVGLAQVERLDALVALRRRTAARYHEQLAGVSGLTLAPERPGLESVHWMYGVVVQDAFGCTRDDLRRALAAEGIQTRTFFVPLHRQPAYVRELPGRRHPVAEHLGRCGLYLPSGPDMTAEDVERVGEAVRRAGSPSSAQTAPRSAAAAAGENRSS